MLLLSTPQHLRTRYRAHLIEQSPSMYVHYQTYRSKPNAAEGMTEFGISVNLAVHKAPYKRKIPVYWCYFGHHYDLWINLNKRDSRYKPLSFMSKTV